MATHFSDEILHADNHKTTVIVIGAGGTGSQVLYKLARMHLALVALGNPGLHVTAYDDDKVSESNIVRQLFTENDIGRYKSDILIERINRFYGLGWESETRRFHHSRRHREDQLANIYFGCVDTIKSRKDIKTFVDQDIECGIYNPTSQPIYWIDIGNSMSAGQVILSTCRPVKQPKSKYETVMELKDIFGLYPEFKRQKESQAGPSCSTAEALNRQDLFVNDIASTYGVNILWKLFKEFSIEIQGYFFNLKFGESRPIRI